MRAETVVGILLLVLAPSAVQGQACVGSHAPRGSFALGAGATFSEDVTGFSGAVGGNLEGPAFASAGYTRTDIDGLSEDGNTIDGRLGLGTVTEGDLSLCLVASGGYTWFDIETADVDGFTIQGGPAIGYSAPVGEDGLFITPHLSGGITHTDLSASALGVTIEESSTDAFVTGGFSFGSESIWLGGTVTQITAEGANPVFGINLGVAVQ